MEACRLTEELLEIAEKAVRKAESHGAEQAEAYIGSSKSFSIEVENNTIKTASEIRDAGCGIRAIVNKAIGFAYVTTIQDSDILEIAERAVKIAKAAIPDPEFVSLPSYSGKYPVVDGLFDSEIRDIEPDYAADIIMRTVDSSIQAAGKADIAVESTLNASHSQRAVANSIGIAQFTASTSFYVYSYPTVKMNDDQTSSYEYQITRKLSEIDPERVGSKATNQALAGLGGKIIEGGELPVILTPLAVATVLGSGFASAINAEEVQYGRSYIQDHLGDEIASDKLNIVDNAILNQGIGSRPYDAEGYPSQKTTILENGVLKSLLHNSYTAYKGSVENTGNAARPSYSGTPFISSSNFIVSPGRGTLDDLVSEIDRGVICQYTADSPNLTTGELSAMIMEGFYIENGEIVHPVKNTLIGINMIDLLKRVHRIGADVRKASSIVSPSLVIESARVTSG
ncbi:MAG: hypothetical protein GF411_11675 [Candidatus Lokiarchaeota archaeon]|nr:hypothetical protein [Candidatus Lokiarchaeota archaeon]